MKTLGTYPQFAGAGSMPLNRRIRASIVSDEAKFLKLIVAPPIVVGTPPGIYALYKRGRRVSASTGLISMMLPRVAVGPGGSDGDGWFAITLTQTGSRLLITDIIRSRRAFTVLAAIALRELRKRDVCVRPSLLDPKSPYRTGLLARPRNFRYFALAPDGLALGFPQGDVSQQRCGRVELTLPYRTVRDLLSAEARRLITEVRPPLFVS